MDTGRFLHIHSFAAVEEGELEMRRLVRSESDRIIGGVCGGLARHLNVDPLILRILFVIGAMINGVGLAVYILLWVFVPAESAEYSDQEEMIGQNIAEIRERAETLGDDWGEWGNSKKGGSALVGGLALVILGILILMRNFGLLRWVGNLWPLVLIAIGALILLNNVKEKS
jgi:phage shock protein PspC (stress-responsive transcriptional regulator)